MFEARYSELMALWEWERQKREMRSYKPMTLVKNTRAKEKAKLELRPRWSALEDWKRRYRVLLQSL